MNTRTTVSEELLKEKEEMVKLKDKVHSNPQKAEVEDLVKLAHHYYKMYEVSEDERSKSLCIGQAGYYGSWAVNKGYSNVDNIKKFIEYLEIDLGMPNPDDTAKEHLEKLNTKLKELDAKND
jgi:hypothetical protein